MSPYFLRRSKKTRDRFWTLVSRHIRFLSSFRDKLVTPNTWRIYHRRQAASDSIEEWIDDSMQYLHTNRVKHKLAMSEDLQKVKDSLGSLRPTTDNRIVKLLNRKVREPRRLLMFPGALFEATINTDEYSQSQILIMLHVPSKQHIAERKPITLLAAPAEEKLPSELLGKSPPTEGFLLAKKWKRVTVRVANDTSTRRLISQGHTSACRRQYTMRHIGSSTVSAIELLPNICLCLLCQFTFSTLFCR